jgi:hypothetical protein
MLSRDEAEQIFLLRAAGLSRRAIAQELGHSQNTVMRYLHGHTTPGLRVARPDLLHDDLAGYCRQRFTDDPHLRPRVVLAELTALGYQGSRPTFYRGLRRHGLLTLGCLHCGKPQGPSGMSGAADRELRHTPQLPIQVPLISGETLISYLGRLAAANHLTLAEVLAVLPPWFRTKVRNHDDRSQHHTMSAAVPQALQALTRLTGRDPHNLARALPAFGTPDDPVRATTACFKCAALEGISQPVPVHLPAHVKACTRHGVWRSNGHLRQLDLAGCPEVIAAQHRASRLLRRLTPQQLILAHLTAASEITRRTASSSTTSAWTERLQILQAANNHLSTPAELDLLIEAATYPDAIATAAIMPVSMWPDRRQRP